MIKSDTSNFTEKDRKFADRFYHQNVSRFILPDGIYNEEQYVNAMKFFVNSPEFCVEDNNSDWSNIGPVNVGQQNGLFQAVWMHPTNPNIILAGGAKNGIFKTVNQGQHWEVVTDDLNFPVIGVKQIINNPIDPSEIIALTGSRYEVDLKQEKILKSNNGGDTWESMELSSNNSLPFTMV